MLDPLRASPMIKTGDICLASREIRSRSIQSTSWTPLTLLRPPCPWLSEPASRMIDQGTDQTPVRVGHIGILLYLSTLSRSRILNLAEVRRHDRDDRSGPLQRTAPSPRGARRRRAQTDRSRAPRRLRTARRGQGRGLLRGKRADRLREPPVGGSCHPPGAG